MGNTGQGQQAFFPRIHSPLQARVMRHARGQRRAGLRRLRFAEPLERLFSEDFVEAFEAASKNPPFDPPEIHENDLMPVVLDCASWGIIDPRQLGWLDPPSPAAISEAKARLQAIA